MSDDDIPTRGGKRPECPDCWHAPHFQKACRCGCPSGVERKRDRDRDAISSHGDPSRNTQPGFF